jgi:proline dehydrogenase
MTQAMTQMGRQFVLGQTIQAALKMAAHAGADTLHSFDMLGEAACNDTDAQGYLKAYSDAIKAIAKQSKTTEPARIREYLLSYLRCIRAMNWPKPNALWPNWCRV